MVMLKNKLAGRTYIKYVLSYLIIVAALMIGFIFIVRKQLSQHFNKQFYEQAKIQLDSLADYFNESIISINQVHSSLKSNIPLITSLYSKEALANYQAFLAIQQHDICSSQINGIIYMPTDTKHVTSTNHWVTYEKGVFCITMPNNQSIVFDPSSYYDSDYGQIIYLSNENTGALAYFPPTKAHAKYILFYLLDFTDLEWQMKAITSDTMPAVALVNKDNQIITGINIEQLVSHMDTLPAKADESQTYYSGSLVQTQINNDLLLISLVSDDFLSTEINIALASTYKTLLLLGAIGLILVLFSMKITYVPLHKLTQRVIPNVTASQGYIKQLDSAFTFAAEQNQSLKDKLENYRISMQKSLFDSMMDSQPSITASNIDQFFDAKSNNTIFAVRMASPAGNFSPSHIMEYLSETVPGTESCIVLKTQEDTAIFLVNYIGTEQNKKQILTELLKKLYMQENILSAISNGSHSPLDIPSLYENAMSASNHWPDIPVVDYELLPPVQTPFAYPYDILTQLSDSLKQHSFLDARKHVTDLFEIIDHVVHTKNNFPDFFIGNILIDILTTIINNMNEACIKFKNYSDLYFETLYYCRSCSYPDKNKDIKKNTYSLLDFYEQHTMEQLANALPFKQMFEASYAQPNFSISIMADHFQVSTAYMSHLIKTHLKMNFSDYLWALRLNKAKELLTTTDMTVDEISIAVGYFNTSSFRRKFKQDTGLTPSDFRNKHEK